MRQLLMKTALSVMLPLCLGTSFQADLASTSPDNPAPPNGHIEQTGDMLIADSQSSTASIESVVLRGDNDYTLNGCGASKCSYDITKVPTGTYLATAHTNEGNFTRTVEIRH